MGPNDAPSGELRMQNRKKSDSSQNETDNSNVSAGLLDGLERKPERKRESSDGVLKSKPEVAPRVPEVRNMESQSQIANNITTPGSYVGEGRMVGQGAVQKRETVRKAVVDRKVAIWRAKKAERIEQRRIDKLARESWDKNLDDPLPRGMTGNPEASMELSTTRLYVGNVPRIATKADIVQHFACYGTGKVTEIKIMNGFGFIEYEDAMDARDVVPAVHGSKFMGERLTVNFARGSRQRSNLAYMDRTALRPHHTPYRMRLTGLPAGTSLKDLKAFVREASLEVVYSEVARHFVIVQFETAADLRTVIEKLDGREYKGARITCMADTRLYGAALSPSPRALESEVEGRARSTQQTRSIRPSTNPTSTSTNSFGQFASKPNNLRSSPLENIAGLRTDRDHYICSTISRDNVLGEEVRQAELLAQFGKKMSNFVFRGR